MIILEELLVEVLRDEGIKASTTESTDPTGEYVLIARTGGDTEIYGNQTTGLTRRERVDIDLNVYARSKADAIKLGYQVQEACRSLSVLYSRVSGVELDGLSEIPAHNNLKAYTFGFNATVNQS